MRTKVTLVLLFLNVALYFFIFYVRPRIDVSPELEQARLRILPPTANDIKELGITINKQSIRLVRRGEKWHISSPIEWPANKAAVASILDQLRDLRHETFFTVESVTQKKIPLSDYGLDNPVITLDLTIARPLGEPERPEDHITLRFGSNTSTANRLYVLSPDGKIIHVVSKAVAEPLMQPLESLRSENLFSIADFEARNLTIQQADSASVNRTRVTHEGQRWSMLNPVETRADTAKVRETINQLASLRIGEFIASPLPPDLNPASATTLRISVEGNNRSETLLLGGPVPKPGQGGAPFWYAQFEWKVEEERKSAVFTVQIDKTFMERLRSSSDYLRDKHLIEIDAASIASLVLHSPRSPELTLQRIDAVNAEDGEHWQLVSRQGEGQPVTMDADAEQVRSLIEQLRHLEARGFIDAPTAVDLEAWGFTNSPERRITLSQDPHASSARPVQIEIGTDAAGAAHARVEGSRSVLEINPEILRFLPAEAIAWRNRSLVKLPAGARIVGLKLTDLQGDKVLLEQHFPEDVPSGDPRATAGIPEKERPTYEAFLACLRSLHAKSFLADHYQDTPIIAGTPRPWRYRLDVIVSLQNGTGREVTSHALMLGDRIGGSTLICGVKETNLDVLFEADQALVDAFWALTYGPKDPGPIPPIPVPAVNPAEPQAPASSGH